MCLSGFDILPLPFKLRNPPINPYRPALCASRQDRYREAERDLFGSFHVHGCTMMQGAGNCQSRFVLTSIFGASGRGWSWGSVVCSLEVTISVKLSCQLSLVVLAPLQAQDLGSVRFERWQPNAWHPLVSNEVEK